VHPAGPEPLLDLVRGQPERGRGALDERVPLALLDTPGLRPRPALRLGHGAHEV
jgi:hypothetical protein